MFGVGPLEMLVGGVCCLGSCLSLVGILLVLIMRRNEVRGEDEAYQRLEAENRYLREQLAKREKGQG